jgi:phospholipase/carboxylesterase
LTAVPEGRDSAREGVARLLAEVAPPKKTLVLVGFSQGGMLAMDYTLYEGRRPQALALLSSSRICFSEWQSRAERLRDLPLMIAHGHHDAELAFHAGEGLRDFASAAKAQVTWVAFEGGHNIPLIVWRSLRKFILNHA